MPPAQWHFKQAGHMRLGSLLDLLPAFLVSMPTARYSSRAGYAGSVLAMTASLFCTSSCSAVLCPWISAMRASLCAPAHVQQYSAFASCPWFNIAAAVCCTLGGCGGIPGFQAVTADLSEVMMSMPRAAVSGRVVALGPTAVVEHILAHLSRCDG